MPAWIEMRTAEDFFFKGLAG
ncbi:hypothetical protein BM590_A1649 [Brucella melitensis M5-90]|nr:hypothetical protein BM590_A1649 [Brucella melitensis M5-90]